MHCYSHSMRTKPVLSSLFMYGTRLAPHEQRSALIRHALHEGLTPEGTAMVQERPQHLASTHHLLITYKKWGIKMSPFDDDAKWLKVTCREKVSTFIPHSSPLNVLKPHTWVSSLKMAVSLWVAQEKVKTKWAHNSRIKFTSVHIQGSSLDTVFTRVWKLLT